MDEIEQIDINSWEFNFNNRAVINTIIGFKNKQPIEKVVKVSLEDFSNLEPRIIATGKFSLAEWINKAARDDSKSVYEDVNMSQGLGLMRLRIAPKKIELREKVNKALSKPPMPIKANVLPPSPLRYQKSDVDKTSSCDSKLIHFLPFLDISSIDGHNDISFNPEGNFDEDETNEGQSHAKSKNRNRSSSQITIK